MKINFCAGPAVIPSSVIEQLQEMIVNYKNTGVSLLSISHRDKAFDEVHYSIQVNLRKLFAAVPMNLVGKYKKALYVCSGQWSEKAADEAEKFIQVDRIKPNEKAPSESYDYIYYTDNETVDGFQINELAKSCNTPLVCDASSSFLSKPINVDDYGIIYAGAQKNAGIPGVTIVIVKNSLIEKKNNIPAIFDYDLQQKTNSVHNTPSVISWVTFELTLEYLINTYETLDKVALFSQEKADLLYSTIDKSNIYANNIESKYRSNMNIIFQLPNEDMTEKFLKQADVNNFYGLKGHRSVGGCRASLYNAVSLEDVQQLTKFMLEFERDA
jgi:phosphoserine aminotransferase